MKASRKNSALRRCVLETLESRQLMAAGGLDTSFSGDGLTTFPFLNGGKEFASDVAVQSDGKTVVVGTTDLSIDGVGRLFKFAIARFNVDGTPDKTFGQFKTGKTTFDVGPRNEAFARSVAIQPDGKILVAGFAMMGSKFFESDFAIIRLLPDGTLDRSFDGDGKRTIDFGENFSVANDIAVQGDGKIVLVGETQDGDFNFAVARLNSNGSLDSSFDGDGLRQVGFGAEDFAEAVTIDNNKIIIVGSSGGSEFGTTGSFDSARRRIAITRLNMNGTRDATFGAAGDGTVLTSFAQRPYSRARSVTIQPGGKIVVAGSTGDNTIANGLDFAVVRYLQNGRLDTTFGTQQTGLQEMGFGGRDQAFGIVNSSGGGLVAAGITNGKFALAGLTVDGAPDNSFGQLGKVTTDFGTAGLAGSVGLASGPRRLVVAGGSKFKTARYFDIPPKVGVFFGQPFATEGGASARFEVTRSTPQLLPLRVFLDLGGIARNGIDYTTNLKFISSTGTRTNGVASSPLIGSLPRAFIDIPAGSQGVSVIINVIDDSVLENVETVKVTLLANAEYEIDPAASTQTASIFDDDQVRINFQPSGVTPPAGNLADVGSIFGDRGSGLRFGWDVDNTVNTRRRNNSGSPDLRFDTLNHMQKPGGGTKWEIAVPNGMYEVTLVAGDPDNIDSAYRMNLEGTLALSGTPANSVRWFQSTINVLVSDGRLTLSNASGAANNKIAFIEIKSAVRGAVAGPIGATVSVPLKPLPPVFNPPSNRIFSQLAI